MSRLLLTLIGVCFWAVSVGSTAAQEAYRVKAGDTLVIEVLEDPNLNRSVLVAPDGRISVPLVGGVLAAGRTLDVLRADLTEQLTPNFAVSPTVFVALQAERPRVPSTGGSSKRMMDVFVVGEANSPGRLEVERETIVLQLFAQMGGFTNFAAKKRIQLRRGEEIYTLNYKEIEAGTSNAGMLELQDGDVLLIPQRRLFE